MAEFGRKVAHVWQQRKRSWSDSKVTSDVPVSPENLCPGLNENGLEWDLKTTPLPDDPASYCADMGFEMTDCDYDVDIVPDMLTRGRSCSFYDDNDAISRDLEAAIASGDEGDKGYLPDKAYPSVGTPMKQRKVEDGPNSGSIGGISLDRLSQQLNHNEVLALRQGLEVRTRKISSDIDDDLSSESDTEDCFGLANIKGSDEKEKELKRKYSEKTMHLIKSPVIPSNSLISVLSSTSSERTAALSSQSEFRDNSVDLSENGFLFGSKKKSHGHRNIKSGANRKIKILMLGDTGVGKSSLMNRFTEDNFNTGLVGTVGVDFKSRDMEINGERVIVQVWDTAGQERFHKITRAYYRGCHGILLAYDVGHPATLDSISYWMKNIQDNASSDVCTCLVGNKMDLPTDTSTMYPLTCCVANSPADGRASRRKSWEDFDPMMSAVHVKTELGQEMAKQYGVSFFETSAKTGYNVQEAYTNLVKRALDGLDKGVGSPLPASQQTNRKISVPCGLTTSGVFGSVRKRYIGDSNMQEEGEKNSCKIS